MAAARGGAGGRRGSRRGEMRAGERLSQFVANARATASDSGTTPRVGRSQKLCADSGATPCCLFHMFQGVGEVPGEVVTNVLEQ